MTHEAFVNMVFRLRQTQKEYVKTRDQQALISSKAQEREIDKYIDEYMKPIRAEEAKNNKEDARELW